MATVDNNYSVSEKQMKAIAQEVMEEVDIT